MNRLKYILSLIVVIFSMLCSCDKYNTDVMGESFVPYNSLVTRYRQLVYVEYKFGSAKVWGPYADMIDWTIEGTDVSIVSDLDSLVVFTYGDAMGDKENPMDGSLTINSSFPYALYLTGLYIQSNNDVAIHSKSKEECYLVLTDKAQNRLNGSFVTEGPLIIDGRGNLNIKAHNDALTAKSGLVCSYEVKVNIESEAGDGIHAEQNEIKFAEGTWKIKAAKNAISNTSGNVVLNGGTVNANAEKGSFVSAAQGVSANQSTCIAIASEASDLADLQRQFIWLAQVDTLTVTAKETLKIEVTPNTAMTSTKLATFTPEFDYKTPWIFIAHPSLGESDWVSISK